MDTSILTTLNVVSLGVPTVISKAASAEQGEILKKLGAEVVYPERDMAVRLAHKLETPNMLDFVQLSRKLNLLKLEVPRKDRRNDDNVRRYAGKVRSKHNRYRKQRKFDRQCASRLYVP